MPTTHTPILNITEMAASQSQPELVFNRAIRILEALSPLQVIDRDLGVPPDEPEDGDRYIVGTGSAGDWVNKDFQIALWMATEWVFITPTVGMLAYVIDEDVYVKYEIGSPTSWALHP